MAKMLKEVSEIIGCYSGQSRKVLEYSQLMKQLIDRAKQPSFSGAAWDPLIGLVDTKEFQRVGNFKEVMNWEAYTGFLADWARSSDWDCSFRRISEIDNIVFLELEERSKISNFTSVVNSLSVYEFNAAGKIRHLDIYLQMELPNREMLQAYEGIL